MNPNTTNQIQPNGVPQMPVQPIQPQPMNAVQPLNPATNNVAPQTPVNVAPVAKDPQQLGPQPQIAAQPTGEVKKPSGGKKIVLNTDPIIRPVSAPSMVKNINPIAQPQEEKQEMPKEQSGSITF